MLRKSMGVMGLSLAAALMAAGALAAECGKGESEAVLVTKNGSITMCVSDAIVESPDSGVTVALETVTCPCAEFVPSEREWGTLKDAQSCEDTGSGLLVSVMKGGKGKNGRTEERMLYSGLEGDVCAYQVYYDGLIHRNSSVKLDSAAVADACRAFTRELYAAFAGTRREPASCPE